MPADFFIKTNYNELDHNYPAPAEPVPDTVKILHKVFKLKVREPVFGDDKLGEFDRVKSEINYVPLLGSETVDTIIHELLHGVFSAFYLSNQMEQEEEEQIVSLLATGLTTIMKDNPTLFKSLQDMLEY